MHCFCFYYVVSFARVVLVCIGCVLHCFSFFISFGNKNVSVMKIMLLLLLLFSFAPRCLYLVETCVREFALFPNSCSCFSLIEAVVFPLSTTGRRRSRCSEGMNVEQEPGLFADPETHSGNGRDVTSEVKLFRERVQGRVA